MRRYKLEFSEVYSPGGEYGDFCAKIAVEFDKEDDQIRNELTTIRHECQRAIDAQLLSRRLEPLYSQDDGYIVWRSSIDRVIFVVHNQELKDAFLGLYPYFFLQENFFSPVWFVDQILKDYSHWRLHLARNDSDLEMLEEDARQMDDFLLLRNDGEDNQDIALVRAAALQHGVFRKYSIIKRYDFRHGASLVRELDARGNEYLQWIDKFKIKRAWPLSMPF
jgi:hypothetical protein